MDFNSRSPTLNWLKCWWELLRVNESPDSGVKTNSSLLIRILNRALAIFRDGKYIMFITACLGKALICDVVSFIVAKHTVQQTTRIFWQQHKPLLYHSHSVVTRLWIRNHSRGLNTELSTKNAFPCQIYLFNQNGFVDKDAIPPRQPQQT